VIRLATEADLPALFAYLNDHLSDNGKDGTALFQPLPRGASRFPAEKEAAFRAGLAAPLGQPGWRRALIALAEDGAIAGHIDLRARPEAAAAHRAMLGMGVDRKHRQRGLGAQLIDAAVAWALADTAIEWIDLEVLSTNAAARQLYARTGFTTVGEIADMFRIDGEQLAYSYMARRIR